MPSKGDGRARTVVRPGRGRHPSHRVAHVVLLALLVASLTSPDLVASLTSPGLTGGADTPRGQEADGRAAATTDTSSREADGMPAALASPSPRPAAARTAEAGGRPQAGEPRGPHPPTSAQPDTRPATPAVSPPSVAASRRQAPVLTSREGFRVASGSGQTHGPGRASTFTVEVEPGTGHDLGAFVTLVTAALLDPRSWTATHALRRVERPDEAAIRIVLATPATVDRYCARAGLRTVGIYSCWDGRRAMLNAWRYDAGARDFANRDTYRTYMINHEVGHGLGYGHRRCPAAGEPAPVMMQQTKTTGACDANAWPYP